MEDTRYKLLVVLILSYERSTLAKEKKEPSFKKKEQRKTKEKQKIRKRLKVITEKSLLLLIFLFSIPLCECI